jgi:hypothetical protein
MDFVCRDYVYSWYSKLGSSQEFPVEVRTTLARVLSILAEKMGEVSNFSSGSVAGTPHLRGKLGNSTFISYHTHRKNAGSKLG